MEKIIDVKGLKKVFHTGHDDVVALKGIDMELNRGEIACITGESGSGKSTFLNLIGGLDKPTDGKTLVDGHNITELEENQLSAFRSTTVGFIFQFHYLLPDFTALENVMLPYLATSYNKKKAQEKAQKLLELVNMGQRVKHKPDQLSGGERQRVAVARALINDPKILLADEPTGNLDKDNTEEVVNLLWQLSRDMGLTLIVVTHNLEIWNKADRKFFLTYGALNEETGHAALQS